MNGATFVVKFFFTHHPDTGRCGGSVQTGPWRQEKDMKHVALNNGVEMPILGFGVLQVDRSLTRLDDRKIST